MILMVKGQILCNALLEGRKKKNETNRLKEGRNKEWTEGTNDRKKRKERRKDGWMDGQKKRKERRTD